MYDLAQLVLYTRKGLHDHHCADLIQIRIAIIVLPDDLYRITYTI